MHEFSDRTADYVSSWSGTSSFLLDTLLQIRLLSIFAIILVDGLVFDHFHLNLGPEKTHVFVHFSASIVVVAAKRAFRASIKLAVASWHH